MMFARQPWWFWPLALLGPALLGYALWMLLAHGVFHFGLFLIACIGALFAVLAFFMRRNGWPQVQQWLAAKPWRAWLWRWGWRGGAVWAVSVLAFFAFIATNHAVDIEKMPATGAAIVVLGSGTPLCKASPALQNRLNTALAVAHKLPQAPVVVSGGQDFGHTCTEGQVMGDYLRAKGLPASRIVQEERSTSTQENLQFSLNLLRTQGFDPARNALVIVTSDFHALRARFIAYKTGFAWVASVNADTPLYLRYAAWLREYFAFGSSWLLGEF